jgi:phosphoribosylaminoimidazole-succinocarboxamide synthase
MAQIPKNLPQDAWSEYLEKFGLKLVSRGKVRDTWRLTDAYLLMIATDRISIFDFVLNTSIPKKGEVLTALTHFWLTEVLSDFDHHLAYSDACQDFCVAADLRDDEFEGISLPNLPVERCLVIKDLSKMMYIFEMIFRYHIGGSVYKKYLKTSTAGGQKLPPNLPKWSKLNSPIFTPSTKEEVGHDVNVDVDYFFAEMEKLGRLDEAKRVVENLTAAYTKAYAYAEKLGILILDTKFEIAAMILADEIVTPDSSRFCTKEDWEKAMTEGRDPNFLDKQPVRDWGATIETPFGVTGINKLDSKNPEHVAFVHNVEVPQETIKQCTERYLKIFEMLTKQTLAQYQENRMGV